MSITTIVSSFKNDSFSSLCKTVISPKTPVKEVAAIEKYKNRKDKLFSCLIYSSHLEGECSVLLRIAAVYHY